MPAAKGQAGVRRPPKGAASATTASCPGSSLMGVSGAILLWDGDGSVVAMALSLGSGSECDLHPTAGAPNQAALSGPRGKPHPISPSAATMTGGMAGETEGH